MASTVPGQAEQVSLALKSLSSNVSRDEKERANNFLETFQKSADSWPVVVGILDQDSTVNDDVKIFAAQTLRSKIKYDFHQLTDQATTNLRDILLRLLLRYRDGPRVIMIQICVAIAALGLQFNTWDTVVEDVISVCGTNSQQSLDALLQFLAVLPEEACDGRRMILTDAELNDRIAVLLTSNADNVLSFLITYTQSPTFKANPNPLLFTCLTSWLTEIEISKIVNTPLLHLAFESLFLDELFDAAFDFIVATFRETRDFYDNTASIKCLYDELYALGPRLGALDNTDPNVFRGITRIYVEAGESWVVLIAHEPEKYEFIVRALAQCTEYNEDLEVTKITFNFWYELTQLIMADKHRRAKELFTPVYAGLVDTMIGHLHYPEGRSDCIDIFKGDRFAEDKFRDFRHEMGDVLKDCCRVLGGSACLAKAHFLVRQKLEEQQCGLPVRWQEVEAPLFSMRMMAREVDTEELEVVPEVMKLLVNLPEHEKIRYTATLVLGRYTEWTAKHPEYLEFQLNYISSGFHNQSIDLISAATQALKHFCQDCEKHLVNHVAQLLPFYQNVSAALDIDSLFEVTEGVARVVAAQPLSRLYEVMGSFCRPIAQQIVAIHQAGMKNDEKDIRKVADCVELLTIFIQTINPYVELTEEHPAVRLLSELWPVLTDTLHIFGSAQCISESVAKCFKNIVFAYRAHSLPLLGPMADILVSSFERYEYDCFLWASGAIVRQFEHEDVEDEVRYAIWQFIERQCINTFHMLEKKNPNDIPELIEHFFRLLMDPLFCHPLEFTQSSLYPAIVQVALASLALELENPLTNVLHVERTPKHPAVHLLNGIWHTFTNIVRSVKYISQSVMNCFKNIIYTNRIHGLRLLGSMAKILVSSFERYEQYEHGCSLWAIGAIVAQLGHKGVDHEVRFVRQSINASCLTRGNPSQNESSAGHSITTEYSNGQAAPDGGSSNECRDSHKDQNSTPKAKKPRKFNPRRPGRRGKRQCRYCRDARRGWECDVHRDDPQRRCTHCVERSLPCSERTWGPEREERLRREAPNRFALFEVPVDTTAGFTTNSSPLSSREVNPAFDAGLNGPGSQFAPPPFEHGGTPPQTLNASSIMRGFEALTGIFPNIPPPRILSIVLALNSSLEIQPEISADVPRGPLPPVGAGIEISPQESATQESSIEMQGDPAQHAATPDSVPAELLPEFSARDYVELPSLFDWKTPDNQENGDGGFPNREI